MSEAKSSSSLQRWIFIGLVAGLAAGAVANLAIPDGSGARQNLERVVKLWVQPVGTVFLRLLFMTVLPLVFSALALGVYGLGSLRELGRIGVRTLVITVALSAISVVIGLSLVNWIGPGAQVSVEARAKMLADLGPRSGGEMEQVAKAKLGSGLSAETLIHALIPQNPVEAAARAFQGDMLAVMFFAVVFGIALRASRPARVATVVSSLEGLYDISLWLIGAALKLAPLGVAALIFSVVSLVGIDVLKALGGYVLTVLGGLAIQLFLVYPLILRGLCGRSPAAFLRGSREVLMTAFSTASSNATLPTTIRVAKASLGIPPRVADFVLTLGSTFNQNGTALFEGVTILFLAQLFGVQLTLGHQALVVALSILAGIGTAGVPGGSIPLIVPVLVTLDIPGEGIFVILGVDRFLDMCRTTLNVAGDLVVAAWVGQDQAAGGEGAGVASGPK